MDKQRVFLYIGEYYATTKPTIISTTLGSCVSVCLYDETKKIGGMNHILLPGEADNSTPGQLERFAVNNMEFLKKGLIKLGAVQTNLKAKVFGGSRLIYSSTDAPYHVGKRNVESVIEYLNSHNIEVVEMDVGEQVIRTLKFHTDTGEVKLKLTHNKTSKLIIEEFKLLEEFIKKYKPY